MHLYLVDGMGLFVLLSRRIMLVSVDVSVFISLFLSDEDEDEEDEKRDVSSTPNTVVKRGVLTIVSVAPRRMVYLTR